MLNYYEVIDEKELFERWKNGEAVSGFEVSGFKDWVSGIKEKVCWCENNRLASTRFAYE